MEAYFKETQARIRQIKMTQIVKRSVALDARYKIKPTTQNPSLLNMSDLRSDSKK